MMESMRVYLSLSRDKPLLLQRVSNHNFPSMRTVWGTTASPGITGLNRTLLGSPKLSRSPSLLQLFDILYALPSRASLSISLVPLLFLPFSGIAHSRSPLPCVMQLLRVVVHPFLRVPVHCLSDILFISFLESGSSLSVILDAANLPIFAPSPALVSASPNVLFFSVFVSSSSCWFILLRFHMQ